ncbi:cell division protein DedD [Prodigiosinella aquatilis]|nr:cell division protein DedD [Prodigiosinella sp. LS101]WJV52557.1 cell division protein DedD [Prodigiosinella sp. LS101]WJV56911.1 cell division protein DedD [Pectobacteriaceae bacterium C111]
MASKFQNRLVGTIILVALGVIVLPGLLDGKKKHYEDEFAAIPLVPKPGDAVEAESMPSINQLLPTQPPEGAEAAMQDKNDGSTMTAPTAKEDDGSTKRVSHSETQSVPVAVAPPVVVKPEPKPEIKPKSETKSKEVLKRAEGKPATSTQEQTAPAGQAFVVQLGALKNSDKVNEIIAKLRLSGYRAYTTPSVPVAGQITRIYVGPDVSKEKLQSSLHELKQLSGLNGQIKTYSAR